MLKKEIEVNTNNEMKEKKVLFGYVSYVFDIRHRTRIGTSIPLPLIPSHLISSVFVRDRPDLTPILHLYLYLYLYTLISVIPSSLSALECI